MMGSKLLRAGDTERGFAGWINRRFDRVRTRLRTHPDRHAPLPAGGAHAVGDRRCADDSVLHVLAARTGAGRGPGCGLRSDSGFAQFNHRSDPVVHQPGLRRLSCFPGESEYFSDHVSDRWLRRHGDQAVERAQEDHAATSARIDGTAVENRGHSCHSVDSATAARGRKLSRSTS